ncbi:MAG: glucuronate isomerase [Bacteroidetes bacterium]|nr:MAG: glucuronate isomerase [Bacteroidota bacterium]
MNDIFITENFLLSNKTAVELYHEYAKDQPIIDYHCHLPVREIAEDKNFENLTQIWLAGDHYKWRAMRTCAVPERCITGDAGDWEKFQKWAETVPKTLRNPLYHWTHLELKRPFGISDVLLDASTAKRVWERCNALLAQKNFSTRGILQQMNVQVVCTTDDPIDTLEYHKQLQNDSSFPIRILPAFRADMAMNIERGSSFTTYIEKLGAAADIHITSYQKFLDALRKRHAFFHAQRCRLSDHGLETVYVEEYKEKEIEAIFTRALSNAPVDASSVLKFKSAVLMELCLMDHAAGWVQQFHLGAMRNTNPRMYRELGPDTGYDSIGDFPIAQPLAKLFAKLEESNSLAKTIMYNLNPADNEVIATLIGNFQDGKIPGKIQYGSAWWFLDQKDGMERQLNALSNMGFLSRFIGMLTDSRSFLSYPRHEYFRRILCNMLGTEMEDGMIPNDMELVGGMVKDICYNNARNYFNFFNDTTQEQ